MVALKPERGYCCDLSLICGYNRLPVQAILFVVCVSLFDFLSGEISKRRRFVLLHHFVLPDAAVRPVQRTTNHNRGQAPVGSFASTAC